MDVNSISSMSNFQLKNIGQVALIFHLYCVHDISLEVTNSNIVISTDHDIINTK